MCVKKNVVFFKSYYKINMNFYTLASNLNKKRGKLINFYSNLNSEDPYEAADADLMREFRINCKLGLKLMNEFKCLIKEISDNSYFITIRPNENKINLNNFHMKVKEFLHKKFVISYTYSLEQKGLTIDTLGQGFHVHIVCNTTHSEKKRCLHAVQKFFIDSTASNCIDVKTTKNGKNIIDEYLINYKSDDGHKIVTKEMDKLWRTNNGLKEIYSNISSSPGDMLLDSKG